MVENAFLTDQCTKFILLLFFQFVCFNQDLKPSVSFQGITAIKEIKTQLQRVKGWWCAHVRTKVVADG